MEPVIERKCRDYINLCKMMFRAQGITKDKLGCCIMMQYSINQGYVAILSVHAANNKDQKFVKQKLEKLGCAKDKSVLRIAPLLRTQNS